MTWCQAFKAFKEDLVDNIIDGAFVKCNKLINRKLSNGHFWIKLSEIKLIESLDDQTCIFQVYKDTSYYVPLSEEFLRREINRFLFTPENCTFIDYN